MKSDAVYVRCYVVAKVRLGRREPVRVLAGELAVEPLDPPRVLAAADVDALALVVVARAHLVVLVLLEADLLELVLEPVSDSLFCLKSTEASTEVSDSSDLSDPSPSQKPKSWMKAFSIRPAMEKSPARL